MKTRKTAYLMLPMLGLVGILGASIASAHGLFSGLSNLTPDQIATRQQAMFQNEANILGVSVDDVKNAWAEGKTLQQLAQEKGTSQDQIQARLKDARLAQLKSQLQTLVDKGVITQAQADKRLQTVQSQIQSGTGRMSMKLFRGLHF